MQLDETFIITFCAVFIRATAMLLSSPLIGNSVPVMVRVFFGAIISVCISPLVLGQIPQPETLVDLAAIGIKEAFCGLAIGFVLQLLLGAIQSAGGIIDLQLGIGSAQLFNPATGSQSTPIGQFKFWLGLVIIFLVNGHHAMFQAFYASYNLPGVIGGDPVSVVAAGAQTFGQLMMLAVQIAAPVIAVTVVVDVAAGLVNKAVPQTQPFLLALPAKLALGLVALSIGLPALVSIVQRGVEVSFLGLSRILGGA